MHRILLLAPLFAGALFAETPSAIALRDARVVTVSGPTLAKGTVLLRNGLIEAVGEKVAIPPDAWVMDAGGLTVYPGLIDALSTWGLPEAASASTPAFSRGLGRTPGAPAPAMPGPAAPATPPARGPEDRPSNTSWQRAADMINPAERRIEEARSSGFTTAVTFPTTGIFAGQGAVINLAGNKRDMVVASPSGQYLSISSARGFGGGFPNSLMGTIAYIRQIYLDAGHYKMVKSAYEKHPVGTKRPEYDRALEGVLDSPRALLPAARAYELERMARLAAELKLNAVLYGAHEAWRNAEALKQFGIPLLVSLKWPERARDADPDEEESYRTLEFRDRAPSAPAALAKAGVPFAFYSDGTAPRELIRAVKRAVDVGLSQADALRALTLGAAEIYGVSDRLGSLEKGKIANLVVTKGDLIRDKTEVKYIFVDGAKFEPVPDAPAPGRPPVPTGGAQ